MSFNFLRQSQRLWLKTDVKRKKNVSPQGAAKKVHFLIKQFILLLFLVILFFPNFRFFMYLLWKNTGLFVQLIFRIMHELGLSVIISQRNVLSPLVLLT